MDITDGPTEPRLHDREQVRALILLAADRTIGVVSISNIPDAPALADELADEARRRGVALTAGSAHTLVARRA